MLCFGFSRPMTSMKCPSVPPASEKRKAMALEMELKLTAQLWATVCSEHV